MDEFDFDVNDNNKFKSASLLSGEINHHKTSSLPTVQHDCQPHDKLMKRKRRRLPFGSKSITSIDENTSSHSNQYSVQESSLNQDFPSSLSKSQLTDEDCVTRQRRPTRKNRKETGILSISSPLPQNPITGDHDVQDKILNIAPSQSTTSSVTTCTNYGRRHKKSRFSVSRQDKVNPLDSFSSPSSSSAFLSSPQDTFHGLYKNDNKFIDFKTPPSPDFMATKSVDSIRSDGVNSSSCSIMSSKQQSSVSLGSYKSYSSPVVGPNSDVHAVQDAGSNRFLLDDITYLCSSIMTCIQNNENKSNQLNSNMGVSLIHEYTVQHSYVSADAACDLVVIMSNSKSRSVVLTMGGSNHNREQETSALNSILNVFKSIPEPYQQDEDQNNLNMTTAAYEGNRTRNSRKNDNNIRNNSAQVDGAVCAVQTLNHFDCITIEALTILMHYISFDCTSSPKSCASSPKAAKAFQKLVLKSKVAMSGMVRLLLFDPLIVNILRRTKLNTDVKSEDNRLNENPVVDEIEVVIEARSEDKDISENLNINNDIDQDRHIKDPTRMGRQRRKNKFFSKQSNVLPNLKTIEEGKVGVQDSIELFSPCSSKGHSTCLSTNTDKSNNSGISSTFAFSSKDSHSKSEFKVNKVEDSTRFYQKLDEAYNRFEQGSSSKGSKGTQKDISNTCFCCIYRQNERNPGNLVLNALNRVLTGKMGVDEEEVDDDDFQETNDISDYEKMEIDGIEAGCVESENLTNPLIFRNVMLRLSGGLPYLARAMTETLDAIHFTVLCKNSDSFQNVCSDCFCYLMTKMTGLSSIIDMACCLSEENRRILCNATHLGSEGMKGHKPILIPSLLKVANTLLDHSHNSTKYNDVGLAALRTLTSLTHENDTACTQLLSEYDATSSVFISEQNTGILIILDILYRSVQAQKDIASNLSDTLSNKCMSQTYYDSVILCLNTLTNILETSCSTQVKSILGRVTMKLSDDKFGNTNALTWMTRWIVSQTSTYREALMKVASTKEDRKDNNIECRNLESHEDEYLVTAGNGFILLASLLCIEYDKERKKIWMTKIESDKYDHTCKDIQDMILSEMPKGENGKETGVVLMINTLKAFCNFYRYSVGDLSVAIVSPVLKLIAMLEEM